MKKEPQPYTTSTMSSRHFDMSDGQHFEVRKALDSTEADRRGSLPSHTAQKEHQAIGMKFIGQIVKTRFENPRDAQFIGRNLGVTAFTSGVYESAQGTSKVMNRRTDMPVMAAEDGWTQTENGLWIQTDGIIDLAIKGADELTFRHTHNMNSADRTRRIGRRFGTSAAFMFNLGHPVPAGTPFQVQYAVRERVIDAQFEARRLANDIGEYPSAAALADIDSPLSSWLRRTAPSREVYSAIEQAQEELRTS